MKKKTASRTMLKLLLTSILATALNVGSAKAQPFVRVYVDQPLGYIPGVPVGGRVVVDVIVEVSEIADNTLGGIVGWRMDIAVDPTVLGIFDPPQYKGAVSGYFLYDFAIDHGYSQPTLFPGTGDPATGYWRDLGETILPTPPGGAGEGYSGRKLVTIIFYSKSETAHSRIDLIDVEYMDATGMWHPVDEVTDGFYNPPEVPEFPIGLALEILFSPVIFYMLWQSRRKKKLSP